MVNMIRVKNMKIVKSIMKTLQVATGNVERELFPSAITIHPIDSSHHLIENVKSFPEYVEQEKNMLYHSPPHDIVMERRIDKKQKKLSKKKNRSNRLRINNYTNLLVNLIRDPKSEILKSDRNNFEIISKISTVEVNIKFEKNHQEWRSGHGYTSGYYDNCSGYIYIYENSFILSQEQNNRIEKALKKHYNKNIYELFEKFNK